MNRRQERLAEQTGHWPWLGRSRSGQTWAGGVQFARTVRCSCGQWNDKSNEAPSKGGNKVCLQRWEAHAATAQRNDCSDT